MANQHSAQGPQPDSQVRSDGSGRPQRNTGEGADSILNLLKLHLRVEDLVNRELPPECEISQAVP